MSKHYRIKAQGDSGGLPARISGRGPFSYLVLVFNQLFRNLGPENQRQAFDARNLLEASMPGTDRQEAGYGGVTDLCQETLIEIQNTVDNLSIKKLDLASATRLHKDLDSLINCLPSRYRRNRLNDVTVYSQLLLARKLLEIIIVLCEDVQGLDELNRLVQRNQVLLRLKSHLESVVREWPEKRQHFTMAVPGINQFVVSSPGSIKNDWNPFRGRLAGDRTTRLPPPPPPPPPPEKNPPKEEEKEKADKGPRPSP